MLKITAEITCANCGTEVKIKGTTGWGTASYLIYDCPNCKKSIRTSVVTIGLHAPEDVGFFDDVEPNCEVEVI